MTAWPAVAAAQDSAPRQAADTPLIERVTARAYTIPTDRPESDGTFAWDSTTVVVTEIEAGGVSGLGYTYATQFAAPLITSALARDVVGADPFDIPSVARALSARLRNAGRPGIGATAISAVDNALWDLKARLLGVSILDLLGATRDEIATYGSGGFTSYTDQELREQFSTWADDGFAMVKMKIGREPQRDRERVRVARDAIGTAVELFVDANGAFHVTEAANAARTWLADVSVTWFEEPVSSDNTVGLRLVREAAPPAMAVAAGEYCWTPPDFDRLVDGRAVDVIQADATRCLGVSGFLNAAELCRARDIPMSAHCAPSLHAYLACCAEPVMHVEWFHDHVRIEQMLFDGSARATGGKLRPDRSRPGFGLDLRRIDAERFLIWEGSVAG